MGRKNNLPSIVWKTVGNSHFGDLEQDDLSDFDRDGAVNRLEYDRGTIQRPRLPNKISPAKMQSSGQMTTLDRMEDSELMGFGFNRYRSSYGYASYY